MINLHRAIVQVIKNMQTVGDVVGDRVYYMSGDSAHVNGKPYILYSEGRMTNERGQRREKDDEVAVYPITLELHLPDAMKANGRRYAKIIVQELVDICTIPCGEHIWNGKILYESIESPLYRADKCMTNIPINMTVHERW